VTIDRGATAQLLARITDRKLRQSSRNPSFVWSSSGKGIATVDSVGMVSGVSPGTETIYVIFGVDTARSQITVTGSVAPPVGAPIDSIVLSPATVTVAAGGTQQFTATGRRSGDTTSVPVSVTWTATGGFISATGLFTAGATAGTSFTVTVALAENATITGQARVTVTAGSPPPSGATGSWTNVTPASMDLRNRLSCDNYGVETVQVDPTAPRNVYAFVHCQGVWESTD